MSTTTEATKRVVLEKCVGDTKYPIRYDLRVQDLDDPYAPNILASAYAKKLDGHQLLIFNTPHVVRWRTFPHEESFGIDHDEEEADRRLYEKLKSEAPALVRSYGFQEVHDLTGMVNSE